jgi:alkylation response protein AidB-like acyl-CoA dehydrogenase
VASGHQAIQHAWAISYCKEHPIHLFHKRMLAASLDFGDADFHLEAVARVIGLR